MCASYYLKPNGCRGRKHLVSSNRRFGQPNRRIKATPEPQPEPAINQDWRGFRNALVRSESLQPTGDLSKENMDLLKRQNESLSEEEFWAHRIGAPEVGGLLLATESAIDIMGDASYWQLVIYVLEHSAEGSKGLVLNRPANFRVSDVDSSQSWLKTAFGREQLYMGGFQHGRVCMMHGHTEIADATVTGPGVCFSGITEAAQGIINERFTPQDFKFYIGSMKWKPGQLMAETAAGAWIPAAASRGIVLKQCLGLPVPLWKEVMQLMGSSDESSQGTL